MRREEGMGRTRLLRFAAITVPAAVVTVGLGVAVVEGAVSATLSSANGFQLASPSMTTNSMAIRPGVAPAAASYADTTSTGTGTAYAETGSNTTLGGMCLGASVPSLPLVGTVGLQLTSSSSVSAPGVGLNASTLNGGTSTLSNVVAGEAQSQAGFSAAGQDPATGYAAGGFAITSGATTIQNMNATAYEVSLNGLSLSNLGLTVNGGTGGAWGSSTPTAGHEC